MAAPIYTHDLTDWIADNDTAAWGELTGANAGALPDEADTESALQGTNTTSQATNTTGACGIARILGTPVTLTTGQVFLVWHGHGVATALQAYANNGLQVAILGSSLANWKGYTVGGYDVPPFPYGKWANNPVDPTITADTSNGTPPTGGTNIYGVGSICTLTQAVAKGQPHVVDMIRYGRAEARFSGGDLANGYATFAGFATANDAQTARWGLIQSVQGGYQWKGLMTIGFGAACDFRDSNKNIFIQDTRKVSSTFDDGVFFTQYNGILYARIKSTASGSSSDIMVPQSEWNLDRLDGSGGEFNRSGLTIDITKDNITWMDLQWLGAGTVRFGVMLNGKRIVCHEWHHSNDAAVPYMRTGSLPVYAELKNQTITDSGSEFRIWCSVVKTEGDAEFPSKDFGFVSATKVVSSTTPIPVVSARSKQALYGIINRKSSYINDITVMASGPIIIELWKNGVLTGGTWTESNNLGSALEFDSAATSIDLTNIRRLHAVIANSTQVQPHVLEDVFNSRDECIRRHFNPNNYDTYTFTARLPSGTTPTDVTLAFNHEDV